MSDSPQTGTLQAEAPGGPGTEHVHITTPPASAPERPARNHDLVFEARGLDFFYGKTQALKDISIEIRRHEITALIGPSTCGGASGWCSRSRTRSRSRSRTT